MRLWLFKFRKSENLQSDGDKHGPAADDKYDTTNRETTGEPHQYEAIELHQHQDDWARYANIQRLETTIYN